ncbi:MAG: sialidase family protein [Bryobacteraceae bacterium]
MLLLLAILATPLLAQPLITHTDVFRAGADGYHTYRIPAIVTGANGNLVAFAEARKENRTDPGGGDIDLVCKVSTDGGQSWSAMRIVDDPGEKWAASNPTPLLDRTNSRLWIFYNRWEPGFGTDRSRPATMNNQTWARWSDDHGQTWSAPRDLTRQSRDFEHWGAIFLGPGGAIQTRAGRLMIPSAMKNDEFAVMGSAGSYTGPIGLMRAYAIYSDDHGATWKRGALAGALTNENQFVELGDGAVLMDARQNAGPHRWFLMSPDGGVTWSRPRAGHALTPVATAIERFSLKSAGADRDRLIWTGPTGPGRKNLVVRVSYDEGQTWINERILYGGLTSYSDAAMLADGTAGILWERGVSDSVQFVTFTRFNREFLEPAGTVLPAFH